MIPSHLKKEVELEVVTFLLNTLIRDLSNIRDDLAKATGSDVWSSYLSVNYCIRTAHEVADRLKELENG